MRTAPALALLSLAATAAVAVAAPARGVCRLITDPLGDVDVASTAPYDDPRIDIVSAGIGTDRERLTAVVRVADVDAGLPSAGLHWHVEFDIDDVEYQVTAERLADGDRFVLRRLVVLNPADANVVNTTELRTIATATGVLDAQSNEVRVTVPLSAFAPDALRRGTRLDAVSAYAELSPGSARAPGAAVGTFVRDKADARRPFVVGTASCARAAR